MITVGIFNAGIELNTMNENSIWLKVKNIFSNSMSAPYGSKHHASFTMGNYRYSFVFVPGDTDRQKVTINSEINRGFSFKNKSFEYFRFKFFDFFPMDSWVTALSDAIGVMIEEHLENTDALMIEMFENDKSFKEALYGFVRETCQKSTVSIHEKIADSFYERYHKEVADE